MLTWYCRKCVLTSRACPLCPPSLFFLLSAVKCSQRTECFITVCFTGRERHRRGQRGEGEFGLLQNYSVKMKHLSVVQAQILRLGSQTHMSCSVLVRASRVLCAPRMVVFSALRIFRWRGGKGSQELDRRENRWVMLFLSGAVYFRKNLV